MNSTPGVFDVDEHYKFIRELDELLDLVKCLECGTFSLPNDTWECPSSGNHRCSECQVDHETNECSACRLAYEDL